MKRQFKDGQNYQISKLIDNPSTYCGKLLKRKAIVSKIPIFGCKNWHFRCLKFWDHCRCICICVGQVGVIYYLRNSQGRRPANFDAIPRPPGNILKIPPELSFITGCSCGLSVLSFCQNDFQISVWHCFITVGTCELSLRARHWGCKVISVYLMSVMKT